jgi:transcription antitermination factor NusA-like protein
VEYEKDTNHPIKFTVPTRAVARILGKGGVNITEIKDSTDTQIDIDKASEGTSGVTNITVRGTKKAAEAAKKAIMAVADQVDDEVSINVDIEARYHRTIIGVGGQTLKELVTRCGGPSDPKAQAGLIHL